MIKKIILFINFQTFPNLKYLLFNFNNNFILLFLKLRLRRYLIVRGVKISKRCQGQSWNAKRIRISPRTEIRDPLFLSRNICRPVIIFHNSPAWDANAWTLWRWDRWRACKLRRIASLCAARCASYRRMPSRQRRRCTGTKSNSGVNE